MTLSNTIVEFYEKLSAWETEVVQGTGLSLPQMHTIEILGIYGSMMMKDLASKVGVTTGTLTITIDNLEKKGLVERISNVHDRRSYLIALTGRGKEVQSEHTQAHAGMTDRCMKGFSEQEQKIFQDLLSRFLTAI